MSIYATIAEIGFKRFDDQKYLCIYFQAVPPHIVNVGPDWEFLPPPVDPHGRLFRAVYVVEESEPQGTPRSIHEFANPLVKLNGQEYHDIRFVDLIRRIEDALDEKHGIPAWKAKLRPDELR
jgi:hypothetical protein